MPYTYAGQYVKEYSFQFYLRLFTSIYMVRKMRYVVIGFQFYLRLFRPSNGSASTTLAWFFQFYFRLFCIVVSVFLCVGLGFYLFLSCYCFSCNACLACSLECCFRITVVILKRGSVWTLFNATVPEKRGSIFKHYFQA